MDFNDKAWLELAARAIGLDAHFVPPHESGSIGLFWGMVTNTPEGSDEEGIRWNPILHGHQTLELMTKMKFSISYPVICGIEYVEVTESYTVPRSKAMSVMLPANQTNRAVVQLAAVLQRNRELSPRTE